MKWKYRKVVFVTASLWALAWASQALAQCTKDTDCKGDRICIKSQCEEPNKPARKPRRSFICYFSQGTASDIVAGLADEEMTSRLRRIGDVVLLRSLPAIMSGPVKTAAARIDDAIEPPQRQILFNPKYFRELSGSAGDMAVNFVVAHELGHHVNADVWLAERSQRHQYEFAADAFAARVLAKLNATEEQTIAAVQQLPDAETDDHPAASARRNEILREYRAVRDSIRREQEAKNCVGSKVWNGTQCIDRCGPDKQWDGNSCVSRCSAGQMFSEGSCVDRCSSDERWDGSSCISRCSASQRWSGSRCVSRCSSNERWDEDEEQCVRRGWPGGKGTVLCGCWGYMIEGTTRRNPKCASGYEVAQACPGWCPGGGSPWGAVCTDDE